MPGSPTYVDPFKATALPNNGGNQPIPTKAPPPSTYSGPINNSIIGTPQGDELVKANQQQAAKIGVTIPGVHSQTVNGKQQFFDDHGNIVDAPAATSTNSSATNLADQTDRDALAQAQVDYQTQAKQVQDTITNIQNGTTPLTAGEQAQIAGLQQQFQALIDQQKLTNIGASGTANIRGYQTGAAEYDPTFQVKTIGSIMSAGATKIADLEIKEAAAVAQLTQAFKDDDIKAVQDVWSIYKDAAKNRQEALQKTIDDTTKAIKEAQDQQQKAQDRQIAADKVIYDTVTKPIQELAESVLKNGAPSDIIDAIRNSEDVGSALAAAGDWLQNATGDLGDYLYYKRQSDITGKIAASYDDWLAAKDEAKAKNDRSNAYATAYASAKGRLDAEGVASGTGNLKPLTEVQAKDMIYAQRGEQANSIIGSLQNSIVGMSPFSYSQQKFAEGFDLTNPYVSNDIRQIRQAERNFATAVLRKESGAAISPSEFATVEAQYFPRPGEDAMTLAQKAQNRETFVNSTKANVPSYDTRVGATGEGLLEQAEKIASGTLQSYTTNHPEKAAEINSNIQTMEKTLGRPISSTEFLQAFPEYK